MAEGRGAPATVVDAEAKSAELPGRLEGFRDLAAAIKHEPVEVTFAGTFYFYLKPPPWQGGHGDDPGRIIDLYGNCLRIWGPETKPDPLPSQLCSKLRLLFPGDCTSTKLLMHFRT